MKPLTVLIPLLLCLTGCGKKETASVEQPVAPHESKPLAESLTTQPTAAPTPPPPATPVSNNSSANTPPAPDAGPSNDPTKPRLSVYDDIPAAQRSVAAKDRLYRDWMFAIKRNDP